MLTQHPFSLSFFLRSLERAVTKAVSGRGMEREEGAKGGRGVKVALLEGGCFLVRGARELGIWGGEVKSGL